MNKVFLDGKRVYEYDDLEEYKISIVGDNNRLELHSFEGPGKIYVYMSGFNNLFSFGKNNTVNNDMGINFWGASNKKPENSQIIIGSENIFNGSDNRIISPLSTKLIIGNRNLFAGHINIWGRNDHVIYDIKTKKRINDDEDIDLGSNNWICEGVTVLPGAMIGSNSVVALGSILNKKIRDNNVLIAGIPARIKKEGINWSRACLVEDVDFKNNINIKERV